MLLSLKDSSFFLLSQCRKDNHVLLHMMQNLVQENLIQSLLLLTYLWVCLTDRSNSNQKILLSFPFIIWESHIICPDGVHLQILLCLPHTLCELPHPSKEMKIGKMKKKIKENKTSSFCDARFNYRSIFKLVVASPPRKDKSFFHLYPFQKALLKLPIKWLIRGGVSFPHSAVLSLLCSCTSAWALVLISAT